MIVEVRVHQNIDTQPGDTDIRILETAFLRLSVRIMSAVTSDDINADILMSPIYQSYQQGLYEHCTSLFSHRAGRILTVQSILSDSAIRILDKLHRESRNSTNEFVQQDT